VIQKAKAKAIAAAKKEAAKIGPTCLIFFLMLSFEEYIY
jgi:hypothetical protein